MQILGDGLIFLGMIRKNGEPVFNFGLQISDCGTQKWGGVNQDSQSDDLNHRLTRAGVILGWGFRDFGMGTLNPEWGGKTGIPVWGT